MSLNKTYAIFGLGRYGVSVAKELVRNGKVSTIQEYIKDGSELKSINFRFKGIDGKNYQLWDIDCTCSNIYCP